MAEWEKEIFADLLRLAPDDAEVTGSTPLKSVALIAIDCRTALTWLVSGEHSMNAKRRFASGPFCLSAPRPRARAHC